MRLAAGALLAAACSGGDGTGKDDTDAPPPPVTVTAYEELPIVSHFQWINEDFEGSRISFHVPEDPQAVLFAFHGTDGSVETVQQIEWLELYNLLEPHGFAFILANSLNRVDMQWDTDHPTVATNLDFQRLSRIRDHLIETTALEEDTPVFDAGFSNGATFAIMFPSMAMEEGWDIRAFLAHNSRSGVVPAVPGAYISAENDELNGTPENVGPVAEACAEEHGEPCPHFGGTEIPLDPRRFARLPQYSLDQSQGIFDEMVELEYVTATGERLSPLDDIEAVMAQYIAESQAPIPTMPPTQIRVVWATHRVSSQHKVEEVDFLLGHL